MEKNFPLKCRSLTGAILCLIFLSSCGIGSHPIPRFGIGGRYLEGKDQFLRGRGGNMDMAVAAFESVVAEDPTYRDSLTYLARGYYRKGRYQDAYLIVQRALTLNKEDEIAWLTLGVTQLRLGQDQKGLETLKGGITLLSKLSKEGYRDYPDWDTKGLVRVALRRTVISATKGLDGKENLLRTTDALLIRLDEEENFQRVDTWKQERIGRR